MESTTAYRQLGEGPLPRSWLEWMGDFPDADNYLIPLLAARTSERASALPQGASAASAVSEPAPGWPADPAPQRKPAGGERIALLRQIRVKNLRRLALIPVWLVVTPGRAQTPA